MSRESPEPTVPGNPCYEAETSASRTLLWTVLERALYTHLALQGAAVSAERTVSTCAAPDVQSVMTFFLPANADTGRASLARELG